MTDIDITLPASGDSGPITPGGGGTEIGPIGPSAWKDVPGASWLQYSASSGLSLASGTQIYFRPKTANTGTDARTAKLKVQYTNFVDPGCRFTVTQTGSTVTPTIANFTKALGVGSGLQVDHYQCTFESNCQSFVIDFSFNLADYTPPPGPNGEIRPTQSKWCSVHHYDTETKDDYVSLGQATAAGTTRVVVKVNNYTGNMTQFYLKTANAPFSSKISIYGVMANTTVESGIINDSLNPTKGARLLNQDYFGTSVGPIG